jgi:hypothetical protein
VNRDARAEKQSARCDPTRERFESSADFPPRSAPAGERPLGCLIQAPIRESGTASLASNAFRVLLGAFLCCHDLVPQSVEERPKIVEDGKQATVKGRLNPVVDEPIFYRKNAVGEGADPSGSGKLQTQRSVGLHLIRSYAWPCSISGPFPSELFEVFGEW